MKLVGTYNSAIKEEGNDHEIEFHEIEITFFKNDQEIELALGALRELG